MYNQDLSNIFIWQGKECTNYLQENSESTKLRALRAHMLMCQRALRAYVL